MSEVLSPYKSGTVSVMVHTAKHVQNISFLLDYTGFILEDVNQGQRVLTPFTTGYLTLLSRCALLKPLRNITILKKIADRLPQLVCAEYSCHWKENLALMFQRQTGSHC